ncbi:MAG: recombinase family protein [Bryobacterales bacterium]|nr:recombinase family protein [Bryobacterales bacterium]
MPVAVYVRVSTEEQRERQSIMTQREFAERYCGLHDLSIFRIYSDDGISGTVPVDRRPEASQILCDARLRKFDQLLVYRLDRLGRETKLILNAVDELEKLGVRVKSMTEEFDTGTTTGRLMLTMLSGFASHERDVIRERSVAGTQRVAQAGAWLGGIVPYGYRKVGEKRDAHLVVSEDQIPGVTMSEADVVREVFRMAAVERSSCRIIAERLNELRVPCAYTRDNRLLLRGKRKVNTSGLWGPGRIRGLIVNTTYKGAHEYGKRTKSKRAPIIRSVPPIVSDDLWQKAQASLQANLLFSQRSAKNDYLLRGLIKCTRCGRTYIGTASTRKNGKREFYYRCNGMHTRALLNGAPRCAAKSVRGDLLEQQVWADVEAFLRNPEAVLAQLHAKLADETTGGPGAADKLARLEGLLAQKVAERGRVVGLFRRGRLSEEDLDTQMDEIAKEESALNAQAKQLRGMVGQASSIAGTLRSVESLLVELRERLDGPIEWEIKRRLVEILVGGIEVETIDGETGVMTNTVVHYRFGQPGTALPVTLPRCYFGPVIRVPAKAETLGDHIRKRRLALKLRQKDVAAQLGVTESTVYNWEANTTAPDFRAMPGVIEFLGYNPVPEPTDAAERLLWQRTSQGLSQKEAARKMGLDPGTLARYERGERSAHPIK